MTLTGVLASMMTVAFEGVRLVVGSELDDRECGAVVDRASCGSVRADTRVQ